MKLLYKRENHHVLDAQNILKPGVNEISDAAWNQHKDSPAVASLKKAGVLFEVADQVAPKKGDSAKSESSAQEKAQDESKEEQKSEPEAEKPKAKGKAKKDAEPSV